MTNLENIIIFLFAAVIAATLFKKLGLGTVLGYLVAGIVIGPWCLAVVEEADDLLHIAELGVVLLLFVIGLELQPSRLWLLRKSMAILGGGQFVVTTLIFFIIASIIGFNWQTALVIGIALSLSSTAFALQLLSEKNHLLTQHGRTAFSILLFQDLIVIPVLALLPLLAIETSESTEQSGPYGALISLATIGIFLVAGHYLIRPLLKLVAQAKNPELFSATSLLVALGTATLMYKVGLSMALGAFIAGVLLADSEFKHELEASIEPFKGLLLGLFFVAVGISMNLGLLFATPAKVICITILLISIKSTILFLLAKLAKQPNKSATHLAAIIPQGGEFAFIIFLEAGKFNIIEPDTSGLLTIAVTLSMALTPLLVIIADKLEKYWSKEPAQTNYDEIIDDHPKVILVGFGRFGQIIARILSIKKIKFTALEANMKQVDIVRRFGNKVYFGDATRLDVLRSAGTANASLLVLAIVNQEASLKIATIVKKHMPNVAIYARARNRQHAYRLMEIGVDYVIRETFLSSVEMATTLLKTMDIKEQEAEKIAASFIEYDDALLKRQYTTYGDEEEIIAAAKETAVELESLFEEDDSSNM